MTKVKTINGIPESEYDHGMSPADNSAAYARIMKERASDGYDASERERDEADNETYEGYMASIGQAPEHEAPKPPAQDFVSSGTAGIGKRVLRSFPIGADVFMPSHPELGECVIKDYGYKRGHQVALIMSQYDDDVMVLVHTMNQYLKPIN